MPPNSPLAGMFVSPYSSRNNLRTQPRPHNLQSNMTTQPGNIGHLKYTDAAGRTVRLPLDTNAVSALASPDVRNDMRSLKIYAGPYTSESDVQCIIYADCTCMPALEVLTIDFTYKTPTPENGEYCSCALPLFHLPPTLLPSLRTLELLNVRAPLERRIVSQLQKLRLSSTCMCAPPLSLGAFLAVLEDMREIEDLRIVNYIDPRPTWDLCNRHPVFDLARLPLLARLVLHDAPICVRTMLEHFSVPALIDLKIISNHQMYVRNPSRLDHAYRNILPADDIVDAQLPVVRQVDAIDVVDTPREGCYVAAAVAGCRALQVRCAEGEEDATGRAYGALFRSLFQLASRFARAPVRTLAFAGPLLGAEPAAWAGVLDCFPGVTVASFEDTGALVDVRDEHGALRGVLAALSRYVCPRLEEFTFKGYAGGPNAVALVFEFFLRRMACGFSPLELLTLEFFVEFPWHPDDVMQYRNQLKLIAKKIVFVFHVCPTDRSEEDDDPAVDSGCRMAGRPVCVEELWYDS
ncbi:hypothetical protein BD413DRAFT_645405 [Trametes elegans]|nr:hypothetical protein BD413DRAFT_645405 [Trametes elegans]